MRLFRLKSGILAWIFVGCGSLLSQVSFSKESIRIPFKESKTNELHTHLSSKARDLIKASLLSKTSSKIVIQATVCQPRLTTVKRNILEYNRGMAIMSFIDALDETFHEIRLEPSQSISSLTQDQECLSRIIIGPTQRRPLVPVLSKTPQLTQEYGAIYFDKNSFTLTKKAKELLQEINSIKIDENKSKTIAKLRRFFYPIIFLQDISRFHHLYCLQND